MDASRLGFWRTYIMTVIYNYLDCGDFHMGFDRVHREDCGHEYLLDFFCKCRRMLKFALTRLAQMARDAGIHF